MNIRNIALVVLALVIGFLIGKADTFFAPEVSEAKEVVVVGELHIAREIITKTVVSSEVNEETLVEYSPCNIKAEVSEAPSRNIEMVETIKKGRAAVNIVIVENGGTTTINGGTTTAEEPVCEFGNPGNAKCKGGAGETPNNKPGWNDPANGGPGTNGRSD